MPVPGCTTSSAGPRRAVASDKPCRSSTNDSPLAIILSSPFPSSVIQRLQKTSNLEAGTVSEPERFVLFEVDRGVQRTFHRSLLLHEIGSCRYN